MGAFVTLSRQRTTSRGNSWLRSSTEMEMETAVEVEAEIVTDDDDEKASKDATLVEEERPMDRRQISNIGSFTARMERLWRVMLTRELERKNRWRTFLSSDLGRVLLT